MFYNILYFFSIAGFCVTAAGTIIYMYDENLAKKLAFNVGKYSLDACAGVLDFFEKEPEETHDTTIILYSDGKTRFIEQFFLYANDIVHNDLVIFRKNENKKTLYKIIVDVNDFTIHSMDKPFLQVEISFGDKKIEIQDFLKNFYVQGNKFDKTFFRWFMKYFYDVELENTWTLNIIDHSVNILKLTQNDVILLKDNKYDIEHI